MWGILCNCFRSLGMYREMSIVRITYYASALVYNYFALTAGAFSKISGSGSLEAVPEMGIWMQSISWRDCS